MFNTNKMPATYQQKCPPQCMHPYDEIHKREKEHYLSPPNSRTISGKYGGKSFWINMNNNNDMSWSNMDAIEWGVPILGTCGGNPYWINSKHVHRETPIIKNNNGKPYWIGPYSGRIHWGVPFSGIYRGHTFWINPKDVQWGVPISGLFHGYSYLINPDNKYLHWT